MKKTLITLLALAGVAMGAVKSGSMTLDFTNAPTLIENDSTLFYFVHGALNEGGLLTFETTLTWNGESTGDYQTILHLGEESRGLTLAVNGTDRLIMGECNNYSNASGHETSPLLQSGANSVVFTIQGKSTPGTAAASVTVNGTTATFTDLSWEDMNWSETTPRYDNITLGSQAPNWPQKAMVHISTDSMKVTYTAAVPEPTTATLSLLALCGLAARRRRR